MQSGYCVIWSDGWNQVNIFHQKSPQKEIDKVYIWRPRRPVYRSFSDDPSKSKTFHQLNYEHDVVLDHVFSGGQRKALQQCWQCFDNERVVYRGGKAFRQEVWTKDSLLADLPTRWGTNVPDALSRKMRVFVGPVTYVVCVDYSHFSKMRLVSPKRTRRNPRLRLTFPPAIYKTVRHVACPQAVMPVLVVVDMGRGCISAGIYAVLFCKGCVFLSLHAC
jgi:hypothetical protein